MIHSSFLFILLNQIKECIFIKFETTVVAGKGPFEFIGLSSVQLQQPPRLLQPHHNPPFARAAEACGMAAAAAAGAAELQTSMTVTVPERYIGRILGRHHGKVRQKKERNRSRRSNRRKRVGEKKKRRKGEERGGGGGRGGGGEKNENRNKGKKKKKKESEAQTRIVLLAYADASIWGQLCSQFLHHGCCFCSCLFS